MHDIASSTASLASPAPSLAEEGLVTRDFILGVCMAYYNSDSLNSIVLECYETLCTHVSAGNCVFVELPG